MSLGLNGRILLARQLTFVAVFVVMGLAVCWLHSQGDVAVGEHCGIDRSMTMPIIVDHPDGSSSVEEVPMFDCERPYTDQESQKILLITISLIGVVAWCCTNN